MRLSMRLMAIANLVPRGERVVDVGCDHAYLPSYLVKEGIIPGALATDVRPGPLKRARDHVLGFGLGEEIEVRLSDGLKNVRPGEGQCLVIAGMGGPLMERILSEGEEVFESFHTLVALPQSDIEHFRRFLSKKGWRVYEEDMVLEEGKFYPMMAATRDPEKFITGEFFDERTPEEGDDYTLGECFGPLLLERRHPCLLKYLKKEEKLCHVILQELQKGESPQGEARRGEMEMRLGMAERALSIFND